jgi:hypothetical protein
LGVFFVLSPLAVGAGVLMLWPGFTLMSQFGHSTPAQE